MKAFDAREWLMWYDLEGYLFQEVSTAYRLRGHFTPEEFFTILWWKSPRWTRQTAQWFAESGNPSVEALTREVHDAESDAQRVELLRQVRGIGLPRASAVLTVCYPERCTILDRRVWEALTKHFTLLPRGPMPSTGKGYEAYCAQCHRLAERFGLKLRDLDRALWGWSWRQQSIQELINTATGCNEFSEENENAAMSV